VITYYNSILKLKYIKIHIEMQLSIQTFLIQEIDFYYAYSCNNV
jgi:hypothetical protein